MKITKEKILDFEQFLARFVNSNGTVNLTDGGLSWGFGRNAVIIKKLPQAIREELALAEPSTKLKEFDETRVRWLNENSTLTNEAKNTYVETLKDTFGVREEIDTRISKITEILNEEVDVNLYRINRNKVSGMRDGDDPSKCVLNSRDSAYLQDLGILYDPMDEVVEKKD